MLQLLLDAGLRVAREEGSDPLSFAVELKLLHAVKMLAAAADCNDLGNHAGVAYLQSMRAHARTGTGDNVPTDDGGTGASTHAGAVTGVPLKRQVGWTPILQSAVVVEQVNKMNKKRQNNAPAATHHEQCPPPRICS